MGKGSRSRAAGADRAAKKAAEAAKALKAQKTEKIIVSAIAGVVALAILLVAAFAIVDKIRDKNGYDFHRTVAAQSKNYKLTAPMMAYFIELQYSKFQQDYSQYMEQIQLDTSASLKDQPCDTNFSGGENITWFQFFYNAAEKQATEMLCILEQADKKGYNLTKADKAKVDESIKQMEDSADENGADLQEYLDYAYGKGTKLKEIRTAMEWYQRSSSFYEKQYGGKEYTQKEIDEYYAENYEQFNTADYASYDFTVNVSSYGTDGAAVNGATSKIKENAKELAAATSLEDFNKRLKAYLTEYYKGNDDYPESEIDNIVTNSHNSAAAYTEDDALSKWAFDKKTKAGDVKSFESTTDGIFKVTVAIMVEPMKRDESVTRDIRHILFSNEEQGSAQKAKEEAEKALNEYKNGEQTEDAFAALATQKTNDPGSKDTGGLYEKVTQGQMVPTFNDWMFDASRQKGDTGIVESDYGYHVMYYPGREYVTWKQSVQNAIENEAYEKTMNKLKKEFSVKSVNKDKITDLLDL